MARSWTNKRRRLYAGGVRPLVLNMKEVGPEGLEAFEERRLRIAPLTCVRGRLGNLPLVAKAG